MTRIGDLVLGEIMAEPEDVNLFLPSNLSLKKCHLFGFKKLGIEEGKMHEGAGFDAIKGFK